MMTNTDEPDEIAALSPEVRALFERVRLRLGLTDQPSSPGILCGTVAAMGGSAADSIMAEPTENPPKRRRGFALLDPERMREVAAAGGRAGHEQGTAHRFSSDEAREAGRKSQAARRVRAGRT